MQTVLEDTFPSRSEIRDFSWRIVKSVQLHFGTGAYYFSCTGSFLFHALGNGKEITGDTGSDLFQS